MKNIVKKFYFTFIAALLFFQAALLPAQDEGPRVVMLGTRDRPAAGSTWMLTLLIAHSEPNEVNILAPPFTGSILLEQVLKGPRYYNPVSGQTVSGRPPGTPVQAAETGRTASVQDTAVAEQAATPTAIQPENTWELWTAMEYRFSLGAAGTVNFGSFTAITPGGETKTAPFSLRVQNLHGTAEKKRYRLVWEGVPQRIQTGGNAVFGLRAGGWNPGDSMPSPTLFMPDIPPGHIMEILPPLPREQEGGLALRLKFIPLTPGLFITEKKEVLSENTIFEIPALRITVNKSDSIPAARPAEITIAAAEKTPPPFPPAETAQTANAKLYQKHRGECDTVYGTARNLWERGYIGDALATLRQAERDHPAGRFFAEIRRGAEQALGFTGTGDEKRSFLRLFLREKNRRAVMRETVVRSIPDFSGEEITTFREGQPVTLDSPGGPRAEGENGTGRGGSWQRVTADGSGGTSGWVPLEKIIFY